MNSSIKTIIFWIVILVSAVLLWQVIKTANTQQKEAPPISYSQFLSQVEAGDVTTVTISGTKVNGTRADGSSFRVFAPTSQEQMLQTLRQKKVEIWYSESQETSPYAWITNLAPLALLAALWYFMIRQMRAATKAANNAAGAGSSATFQGR